MNKCTVLGAAVTKDGNFKNDNGEMIDFQTIKQPGKLEVGGFAYPFDIRLDKGQTPWPVGDQYVLDLDAMVQVNKGVVSLSKFHVLKPVK